jgi:ketosteroid isomerase-like protein
MPAIALIFLWLAQGTPLERLIQTERDFSRASESKGARDAFLAYVADDGIVFRPGPVLAKKWIPEHPPIAGLLTWRPVYADIARAGDLGYTTGPYELKNGETRRSGNYFTVWKQQPDGTYKFVVDFGTANPEPAKAQEEQFPPAPAEGQPRGDPGGMDQAKEELLRLDRELSAKSSASGIGRALLDSSADGIRVLRTGRPPALGRTEMSSLLAAKPGAYSWTPEKADVSASVDLGYTYGSVSIKAEGQANPQSGYYVRVWKKQGDGRWLIVLDVLN